MNFLNLIQSLGKYTKLDFWKIPAEIQYSATILKAKNWLVSQQKNDIQNAKIVIQWINKEALQKRDNFF